MTTVDDGGGSGVSVVDGAGSVVVVLGGANVVLGASDVDVLEGSVVDVEVGTSEVVVEVDGAQGRVVVTAGAIWSGG